ncbi:MAG: type II toxin-antitoxin system VapC family toxin [Acidobacteriota bacterium]
MTADDAKPLSEIPAGASVFLDATIFVYHFTGASLSCRSLLARCEAGGLHALTSTLVLAEVTHRLMTIEAVARGLVAPGNVVKKLRGRPEIVRQLSLYQEQVEKIPWMGVEVVPLDRRLFLLAAALRTRYGLLTNDSILLATALDHGTGAFASADRDFERVDTIQLYYPPDLEESGAA